MTGIDEAKKKTPLDGRRWLTYLPVGTPKGAVIILIGYGGWAKDLNTKITDAVVAHGFVACVPQGLPDANGKNSWNVGYPCQTSMTVDDVAFLEALTAKLKSDYSVRSVFLTGMSNGGEMCYQMAYRSPKTFNAIASVSGLTLTSLVAGGEPLGGVPFMELHGTEDKTSLWNGDLANDNQYWGAYLPVEEAVGRIVTANSGAVSDVDVRRYSDCVTQFIWRGRCETRLYRVEGGVHSWFFECFPTGEEICTFFEKSMLEE